MAEKQIKIIEICFAGSNSLMGGIINEFGVDLLKEVNTFRWIIFVNQESFEMIKQECSKNKIKDYILAERRSMVVSNT